MQNGNNQNRDWRRLSRAERVAQSDPENVGTQSRISGLVELLSNYSNPILIGAVVSLLLGIIILLFIDTLAPYALVLIGLGIVLLFGMGAISLSKVTSAFLSRSGKYGTNTLIMISAFVIIVIILNLLSIENNQRFDLTANNQFSLAPSTKELLSELDTPVKAIAFYPSDISENVDAITRFSKASDMLSEFSKRSNKFTYEIRDPDLEPDLARSYGVNAYESIVVYTDSGELTSIVQPSDVDYSELEQDLYTSMLIATSKGQKTIYFLEGHGEKSILSSSAKGYSTFKEVLNQDNYNTEILKWDPTDDNVFVPDDAALLVIPGPTIELPDSHAQTIHKFLQGKNPDDSERRESSRLIFLGEPDTPESFRALMAMWGIILQPGYILDLELGVTDNPNILRAEPMNLNQIRAEDFELLPPDQATIMVDALRSITSPESGQLGQVYMPGTTALVPVQDELRWPVPLTVTSPLSFLIDDPDRTDPIPPGEENADPMGPFFSSAYMLAVGQLGSTPLTAPPDPNQLTHVAIFGDSDFASNTFLSRGSGTNLLLNTVNYVLGDYSLISIRDRAFVYREFNLDANEYDFVRFSSWFILPGLLALAALSMWWVRR
ncbi:MAG: Gldg family protein [Dehalococcoidia bacterium]